MPAPTRRIALVQQRSGDPGNSLERAESAIREAAGLGARLVCLQELFRTRYFPRSEDAANFDLAEGADGETARRLGELASELGLVIVAPIFERRAAGVYHNSALVLDADGSRAGHYRKMHVPDDPGFHEKFYFAPGDLGFRAFDTAAGRIGVLICWDQWFPEAARLVALDGAEILLFPTAIGWDDSESDSERAAQLESWQLVQRAHAVANGLFVAAANRVGREGNLTFWGSSFVCDPQARVLAEAPADSECVLVADCDLGRIEQQRRAWPYLRDRRVDAYADLTRRFRR
ncbi:MAG: carbon-nitrogen hydrolase [Proteobacteria bacterium]|nr:carbon-nitrogen hydrolase [Pseudomonadota bacterium]